MKYQIAAMLLLSGLCAAVSRAGDGMPTQAKLNRLGLGALQVATDAEGTQVRGKFYFSITFGASTGNGANTFPTTTFTLGTPLTYGPDLTPQSVSLVLGPDVMVSGTTTTTGATSFNFSFNVPPDPISFQPSFFGFPTILPLF